MMVRFGLDLFDQSVVLLRLDPVGHGLLSVPVGLPTVGIPLSDPDIR